MNFELIKLIYLQSPTNTVKTVQIITLIHDETKLIISIEPVLIRKVR